MRRVEVGARCSIRDASVVHFRQNLLGQFYRNFWFQDPAQDMSLKRFLQQGLSRGFTAWREVYNEEQHQRRQGRPLPLGTSTSAPRRVSAAHRPPEGR